VDSRKPYHNQSIEKCYADLKTNKNGLSKAEAQKRIEQIGLNKLQEGKKQTIIGIFVAQFANVMIWVLMAAAIISALLGEHIDAIIIGIVILINAILGTVQEAKAEQALEALNSMAAPMAKVYRDGKIAKIKAEGLTVGDVVLIEAGDSVPADLRLIEAASVKAEESALTGESVPVDKDATVLCKSDALAGDRINMAFMGSSITYGRGLGVVAQTAMNSEMGKISESLASTKRELSPLQKKLDEISKIISIAVLVIAAVMFGVGLLMGNEVFDMFLTSVSLAVAAIPEGLVAVVTIVLALGMQKMAERGAIIRKLPAVETLGCTRIICSDKTGTLTQNKMTVMETWSKCDEAKIVKCMVLCNDGAIDEKGNMVGDPTETALLQYAIKQNWDMEEVISQERDAEIPFDSDRKLMTVIKDGVAYVKGAPDVLIKRCDRIITKDGFDKIDESIFNFIDQQNDEMANQAYRVLAFATKKVTSNDVSDIRKTESGLDLLGLCGMIDPPRQEAKLAVADCKMAGIKPVMITGDHGKTATAIAKQLGILADDEIAITGEMLNKMSDEELDEIAMKTSVYARVAPEHKVRIVNMFQKKNMVVAMTGDGVNDAPALKTADIGVGMGITGTDVSKAAADMVLTDDNFATIVKAVKQGRKVYQNIRKAVRFLLSSNTGEVIALFVATLIGWRILGPVHILWINLVTDTFPALALGLEPTEGDVMKAIPRDPKTPIIDKKLWKSIGLTGFVEACLTLIAFVIGRNAGGQAYGMTMAFLTLGISQLFAAYGARSDHSSMFTIGVFKNKVMILAMIFSCLLQVIVVIVPFLRETFELTMISPAHWVVVFALSIAMLVFSEIEKVIIRFRKK
jgi:P-type Ca2+ transporter type 2C